MSDDQDNKENLTEQIVEYFVGLDQKIMSRSALEKVFAAKREEWQIGKKISVKSFIKFTSERTSLTEAVFDFPRRKEVRYVWGEVSPFSLVERSVNF